MPRITSFFRRRRQRLLRLPVRSSWPWHVTRRPCARNCRSLTIDIISNKDSQESVRSPIAAFLLPISPADNDAAHWVDQGSFRGFRQHLGRREQVDAELEMRYRLARPVFSIRQRERTKSPSAGVSCQEAE